MKEKNSESGMETQASAFVESSDDDGEKFGKKQKKESIGQYVIEIKNENLKIEKVCRICHFGSEPSSGDSQIIDLGCDCKGELGSSHPNCAQAWFTLKGDRTCEICGKTAKNIRIDDEEEGTSIFMMEWNEMRLVAATLDNSTSVESSRRCKRSFCNLLLACLVLAFLVPWFFRSFNLL